jgi:hypothetical protein
MAGWSSFIGAMVVEDSVKGFVFGVQGIRRQ